MKTKNKKGVTFVEIMTVVSIIGIMTGVFLVFWDIDEKETEEAAREVVAALREAQNAALTGKSPKDYPCRYEFKTTKDSGNYQIIYHYYNSSVGSCQSSSSQQPYASYSLKNGVKFIDSYSLSFSVPHGTLTESRLLKISKESSYYSICVCPSGKIEERKVDLSNCNTVC